MQPTRLEQLMQKLIRIMLQLMEQMVMEHFTLKQDICNLQILCRLAFMLEQMLT